MKNKRKIHIKVEKSQQKFLIWPHSQKKPTNEITNPKGFTFRLKDLGLSSDLLLFLFEDRAKLKSPSENFPPLTYLFTYYSRINDSFVTKQTCYDVENIYLGTIQCTVLVPAE